MAYVITEPCIGTKDSACVDVCPVDCIHPRKDEPEFESAKMLNIHPDECIDCGACVPACPVEAIFALDEVPDKWKDYIQQNADLLQEVESGGLGSCHALSRFRPRRLGAAAGGDAAHARAKPTWPSSRASTSACRSPRSRRSTCRCRGC